LNEKWIYQREELLNLIIKLPGNKNIKKFERLIRAVTIGKENAIKEALLELYNNNKFKYTIAHMPIITFFLKKNSDETIIKKDFIVNKKT